MCWSHRGLNCWNLLGRKNLKGFQWISISVLESTILRQRNFCNEVLDSVSLLRFCTKSCDFLCYSGVFRRKCIHLIVLLWHVSWKPIRRFFLYTCFPLCVSQDSQLLEASFTIFRTDLICPFHQFCHCRIFVNRSLHMENIKFFGFDMDYTLAGKL